MPAPIPEVVPVPEAVPEAPPPTRSATTSEASPTPGGIPLPPVPVPGSAPPQAPSTAPGEDEGGPPARPPPPPPTGLLPAIPAPVLRGPAIPVPQLEEKDWGAEDWEDDDEAAVYGGILGTIVDQVSGESLENVEVSIPELDLRALSDKSGLFMIRGIRVRQRAYEVLLEAPGYQRHFDSLELREKGTRRLEWKLTPLGW